MSKHCVNKVTGKCAFCGMSAGSKDMLLDNDCAGPSGLWPTGAGAVIQPPHYVRGDAYIPTGKGPLDPACQSTSTPWAKTLMNASDADSSKPTEEVFNKEAYDQFMRGL